MRKFGVALAATVLLMTAACGGGGSGDRPTADEVSKSLRSGKAGGLMSIPANLITPAVADCFAKAVVDSKLSDDAVKAVVEGDTKFKGDAADTKALTSVVTSLASCAKDAVPAE